MSDEASAPCSPNLPAPAGKVRDTEERFRLLVESVEDYAIFMLDENGIVTTWNIGAERIKGYLASEIIGRHFSCFYPPERVEQNWPAWALGQARAHGRIEDEGWRVRKDGTRFWANVVITALQDRSGEPRGFAKVTRDLTERRRLDELERASRRMNEFLAMLAHELRNPLTPMANVVALLKQQPANPALEWCTGVMERQVGHVARLVDDLLDVGRITSGKIALQREPVDLTDVVALALDPLRVTFADHGIDLLLNPSQEPLRIRGDAIRLSQAVINLLDNALKYTPKGGRVVVTTKRQSGDAVLHVRDTGIGIAPEIVANVFDLFSQGGQTFERTKGGLGIGLSIVRQLVELHDGAVEAFSAGIDQGSEFVVRLPLARDGA